MALSLSFFLNLSIQFYSNNVTNIYQLTSQSTTTCSTTQRSQITVTSLHPTYTLDCGGCKFYLLNS